MKTVEEKELEGGFEYRRFEFHSRWLGTRQTLGIVKPREVGCPKGTIYYFHAGNTDDRMMLEMQLLERLDASTRELLVSHQIQFALPSFGLNFLVSAKHDPKRPFEEYFFEEVMPRAEEGTETKAESRFTAGASQGGHVSLVAFLRKPHEFKGVASTIGALLNFDFRSPDKYADYVRRSGITADFAASLKGIFHGFFESYALYRTVDPMLMLEEIPAGELKGKRILVETGSLDDFGFHIAMNELSEKLRSKGIEHRFEFVEGGRHEPVFVMSRFPKMLRFLLEG